MNKAYALSAKPSVKWKLGQTEDLSVPVTWAKLLRNNQHEEAQCWIQKRIE